jgi:hypothetical protein
MWKVNGAENFDNEIIIWKMMPATTFIKIVLVHSFQIKEYNFSHTARSHFLRGYIPEDLVYFKTSFETHA